MKIAKEEIDSLIKEAATEYVWGMKNISRLGNKYKLTTLKRIIKEELEAVLDEEKDACYHKVRSRYDVWPSAYASGALVQCRKVGAKNWGKSTTKEELELYEGKESLEAKIRNILIEEGGAAGMKAFVEGTEASEKEIKDAIEGMKDVAEHEHGDYYLVEDEVVDENLNKWFKEKWVQAVSGKPCARQPGQKTTPKCVKSSKRASMSKKERESTQRRKRAADPDQPKKTGAAKPTYVSTDKPKKKKKKAKKEGMIMNMEKLKEIIVQEMKDVLDTYGSEVSDRNKKSREKGSKALGLTEGEYYVDALDENEEYCPVCAQMEEAKEKKACKPSKGKRFAKRVDGKCRSYGQAGQAKGGGDRIRPGTKKGDAYCARSAGIKKCKNPPCANTLSRKKWKCRGKKSMKS